MRPGFFMQKLSKDEKCVIDRGVSKTKGEGFLMSEAKANIVLLIPSAQSSKLFSRFHFSIVFSLVCSAENATTASREAILQKSRVFLQEPMALSAGTMVRVHVWWQPLHSYIALSCRSAHKLGGEGSLVTLPLVQRPPP